jgi:hypothetical protein
MDVWLTFGGLGCPVESVSNLSKRMRIDNFVGAASRELQEGGFAVESSLLASAEWNPAILIQTKFGHL